MTFPLAAYHDYSHHEPTSPVHVKPLGKLSGLRILLVDDHEPTRSILAKLLVNRRHNVTTAGSVNEALSAGKQSRFDLVITDIGLPDGSGHDLFKKIVQHSPEAKGIALTGYGMDSDLATSKNSGFSAHLTKPIRMDALEAALATALK